MTIRRVAYDLHEARAEDPRARACRVPWPIGSRVGSDRLALLERARRARSPLLVASGVARRAGLPEHRLVALRVGLARAGARAAASRGRRAAALADGWLAGTVFYVVLLRWLDHTFLHFSAIPWPITWLPIAALAAYCGLYVGAHRGRRGVAPPAARRRAAALGLVPALWVAGEWLRGHLMGGFPWGLLGYSQHARPARDPDRRAGAASTACPS